MYVCVHMETDNMLRYGNESNKWWNIIKKKILQAGLRNKIVLMQYTVCCLFEMIHDRALSN